MDQPRHSAQRKTVSPMFTTTHLDELATLIRERAIKVLDNLPRNETFNFVERVSIELTTHMLATLFDFPWEKRRKLIFFFQAEDGIRNLTVTGVQTCALPI